MHPARSAILFTPAFGMGCGLLVLLGVFASGATIPSDRWFGAAALGLALGAVALGLAAWRRHPGHPGGVFGALAQWRSSWLARSGALAAAACAASLPLAVGWIGYGEIGGAWRAFGIAAAMLAGVAVHATAMVYATVEPVPAWCNRWTVPLFLALSGFAGALWLNALLHAFGRASPDAALIVVVTLFLAFFLKRRYWRFIDAVRAAQGRADEETPRVAREMDCRIDRERAIRLRRYAFVLLFALPLVLTMAAMEAAPWPAAFAALAAALSGSAGIVIERLLFFGEAGRGADAA
ncbi:MAG: dimethyl sulfoxide reductase anchor subunit [Defluviicoccus sp.]|nr:dimethyl sulfoxide reductase anchor subunit [Defluviicoccus sp.]